MPKERLAEVGQCILAFSGSAALMLLPLEYLFILNLGCQPLCASTSAPVPYWMLWAIASVAISLAVAIGLKLRTARLALIGGGAGAALVLLLAGALIFFLTIFGGFVAFAGP
jgi:hypothetical protein